MTGGSGASREKVCRPKGRNISRLSPLLGRLARTPRSNARHDLCQTAMEAFPIAFGETSVAVFFFCKLVTLAEKHERRRIVSITATYLTSAILPPILFALALRFYLLY